MTKIMNAYLVYDDNGYDAIGNVYVIAAIDTDAVKSHIASRWGISLKEVNRYWSIDPIDGVTVNPDITTTTNLVD